MIRLLCEPGTDAAGEKIAAAILSGYDSQEVAVLPGDARWNSDPEWDDVLVVVFQSHELPPVAQTYIEAFRNEHTVTDPETNTQRPGGFVIPVATNPHFVQPSPPISGLKSLLYDGSSDAVTRLVRAVGVFLGMALRPGEYRIFISYRIADGREIATDLNSRLLAAGFHPWLDEARENFPPGADVQDIIRANLKSAAMILVVDTPQAPKSNWIKLEIDVALGELIPVLPVVVGPDDISRFITLSSLRRRAPIKPDGVDRQPLSDADWNKVLHEVKELLFQAYQRRLRTVFHAEQNFRNRGFDWSAVDLRRRMYRSARPQPLMPHLVVLSHCSIHDVSDIPALRSYSQFIDVFPDRANLNQKVCVYDRDDVLAEAEIETIRGELQDLPFILAHYNELGVLLDSDFTKLR
jgi:hypothetical protein